MGKLSIFEMTYFLFKIICAFGLTILGIIFALLGVAFIIRLFKTLIMVSKERKLKAKNGEKLNSFAKDVSDYIDEHYN